MQRAPASWIACAPPGIGTGRRRPGRRLLTVGTDCAVGKMVTSLAIEKELLTRGVKADFRASGQTGIFIAGGGVSVDAVVSDFVAGAAELLSPSSDDPDHWDIVEGQGSLFHPSYAAVTLGLIHGSQPDALVLCHDATRTVIDGLPDYAIPDLSKCMDLNLRVAALTNPEARFVGVALNTSKLSRVDAEALITRTTRELGLPCCDPVRTGVDAIVDEMLRPSRA